MMQWKRLVGTFRISLKSDKAWPNDKLTHKNYLLELSVAFNSDYRRVIKSDSFRRLQDKTQVFPLERNDFVRTRLTHSLEVAMHTRDLLIGVISKLNKKGIRIDELNESYRLLETAALIHDIGNPPFGHFGEEAIRIWFSKNGESLSCWSLFNEQQRQDFLKFEGNAQTIRLLTKLHNDNGSSETGMNLTASTLDSVIKYTASSDKVNKDDLLTKKVGYFYSEEKVFKNIKFVTGTMDCRHPLVFLLEAADDVAYTFSDIEDAYNYGLYSYRKLKSFIDEKTNTNKFLINKGSEAAAIQEFLRETQKKVYQSASQTFVDHYEEIMSGTFHGELINEECDEVKCFKSLKEFSYKYVFQTKTILDQEVLGFNIINRLLDEFIPVVLKHDKESMNKYEERLFNNLPRSAEDLYKRETDGCSEVDKDYYRLKMAVDFICNMTDGYAKKLHDTLFN
ncbi:deoxyguanosinetriphosphate triphosphohydrolase [Enterococcus sp. DIV0242_7C1]|uniref:Deoxyguanosinetriphosphate triphosphohydrolase-like protein n=1 Tax=Candidatus Enterococcus dunnyi TaxID=1834192 RepID=A0A200JE04_9ENTE|nr:MULTISPECIES: deoxyguanosinetriphosphate triphosphohydrolase [unclassified Enterococcus]MBO0471061.1 deoxyguanosinetriphosphate triphosphohydrolase [Enterococcus sp. DIV0242_7C1]OUZ34797.1 deoxyguanosinetriphosphate triphosphohydrolase-like protein [Enterococcus sp. 9D6_DIV0238]